jgi:hypothetical protein
VFGISDKQENYDDTDYEPDIREELYEGIEQNVFITTSNRVIKNI